MSDPKVHRLQNVYPYELVASPTGSVGVQVNFISEFEMEIGKHTLQYPLNVSDQLPGR